MEKNGGGKENTQVRLPMETKSSSPKSQANSMQSQSLMSLNISFGVKHPSSVRPTLTLFHDTSPVILPHRSGQKTLVTVCPTFPAYHFMGKGAISLKIVPCLTGFSNISHFLCKKKAQHEPPWVSPTCSHRIYHNGVAAPGITAVQTNTL